MKLRKNHGKYHDEVLRLETGETRHGHLNKCNKSVNHEHQRPLSEVSMSISDYIEDASWREDELFRKIIQTLWSLTALLETKVGQFGTCFIQRVDSIKGKPCPDLNCSACRTPGNSAGKRWYRFTVSTVLHVVTDQETKDNLGADGTVHLDYDNDTIEKRKSLHSFKRHSEDRDGDWCLVDCYTHDGKLFDKYERLIEKHYSLGSKLKENYGHLPVKGLPVVVVSHPHGLAKRVSIGKVKDREINKEVREDQDFCNYTHDAATCPGSSGAAVYIFGKWQDGFGHWFGHPHSHKGAYEDNTGQSSSGVDSTWRSATTSSS